MICAVDTVIIGNPNSGQADRTSRLKRCAEILRENGSEVEVWPTERPQHATELASLAGARLVVAAGGDGTVNEVINGLSTDASLGIIPLGTANVLARELGIPRDPNAAARRILAGDHTRIDLGLATDEEGDERRFACMAGIGFDAEVVRRVSPRLKRFLGIFAFPLTGLQVYFRGGFPTIQLRHNGSAREVQFAIIANGQYYGGDFRMSLRSDSLTNGEFEVVPVKQVRVLLRPDIVARIFTRQPLGRPMKSFPAQEVRASTDPESRVPVQLDGEVWGHLPMTFRVKPGALRVIH